MRSRFKRRLIVPLLIVAAAIGLAACGNNTATTTDKCAIVLGNGQNGNNANVQAIYYAGQEFHRGNNQIVRYFPCNSRDYLINNGNQYNANNVKIGDRFTLSPGVTSEGTQIKVAVNAYFTLNENRYVLENDFWPLCQKYTCASNTTASGHADSSTPGWNNMLGEVFGSAVDQTMHEVTPQIDDSSWTDENYAQWQKLDTLLAQNFDANVRQVYGYNANIFCGSGNSNWTGKSPGKGQFVCTNVRFEVTGVWPTSSKLANQSNNSSGEQAQIAEGQRTLAITTAKYGSSSLAGWSLAMQDVLSSCPKGSTCVVNTGSDSSVIPSSTSSSGSTSTTSTTPSSGK